MTITWCFFYCFCENHEKIFWKSFLLIIRATLNLIDRNKIKCSNPIWIIQWSTKKYMRMNEHVQNKVRKNAVICIKINHWSASFWHARMERLPFAKLEYNKDFGNHSGNFTSFSAHPRWRSLYLCKQYSFHSLVIFVICEKLLESLLDTQNHLKEQKKTYKQINRLDCKENEWRKGKHIEKYIYFCSNSIEFWYHFIFLQKMICRHS